MASKKNKRGKRMELRKRRKGGLIPMTLRKKRELTSLEYEALLKMKDDRIDKLNDELEYHRAIERLRIRNQNVDNSDKVVDN